MRYAAIDIGTVTCRMLVADVDALGALREVRREYAIANLGEGVDATGLLKPEAMARVAAIVRRYLRLLDDLALPGQPSLAPVAVATSATRDAANADELAALLAAEGVRLSVVPGEQEAALSFSGASLDFAGEDLLVVDVGGGSTEVVAGRAGGLPSFSRSFDVGCRRVTERFFSDDPPTLRQQEAARAWIAAEMASSFEALRSAAPAFQRVVAVAGTATTAVAVREGMERYDAARVHRSVVSQGELDGVRARLAALPLAQRKQVAGLDPGRAPVIVAGLIILREVLALAGAASFTVSETDILQGIVAAAARGDFDAAGK